MSWSLTIVGNGSSSKKWQKSVKTAGIADRCNWTGEIPRESVLKQMQQSHVLIITSVYDLTSTVTIEALANGLPVICPDHCGFRDAITAECGIKVPAASKRDLIIGLRDAIVRLDDESFRLHLAGGAITRSVNYEWDKKAQIASEIYYSKLRSLRA
jgi:glycosyltransferase involved in cell wall biosynthesis